MQLVQEKHRVTEVQQQADFILAMLQVESLQQAHVSEIGHLMMLAGLRVAALGSPCIAQPTRAHPLLTHTHTRHC